MCLLASIETMFTTAFHFALLLNKLEGNGTLQVWGLLTDLAAPSVVYPNSTADFSFVGETDQQSGRAVVKLDRAALEDSRLNGLYLCVMRAVEGPATFSLRAAVHSCPLTLADDGMPHLCSSNGTDVRQVGDTCPQGICICRPPHKRPVPAPAGIGFDDCSASVFPLELTHHGSIGITHMHITGGTSHFFSFDVTEMDHFTWFDVQAVDNTSSVLELYLAHLHPPGRSVGRYDLSSSAANPMWRADLSNHIHLSMDDMVFKTGKWWLAVFADGTADATYHFNAYKSPCPHGCSGRGLCNDLNHTCTCHKASFEGDDCSMTRHTVQLGTPLNAAARSFHLDRIIVEGLAALPATAALRLTASFGAPHPLPGWAVARPVLLVTTADATPFTASSHQQLPLAAADTEYSLELGQAELVAVSSSGSLYLELRNPLSVALAYNLTVQLVGHCLNECSQHGACSSNGTCVCMDPWLGGDCSVDGSYIAGGECAVGALKPVRDESAHGTCFKGCDGASHKWIDVGCASWTCDAKSAEGKPLRQKGTTFSCVVDECSTGPQVVRDMQGGFTCTKQCVCPADGGACTLAAECNAGSAACSGDLKQLVQEGGKYRCVEATVKCKEGDLLLVHAVSGGSAYGVCVCSADGSTCAFHIPESLDLKDAVIICNGGFELKGGSANPTVKRHDGSSMVTGGSCRRYHKGTSGGMVFFWCIFTLALSAGLVFGARWGREHGLPLLQRWRAARMGGGWDYEGDGSGQRLLP